MEKKSVFQRVRERTPADLKRHVDFNFEFVNTVMDYLEHNNMTQKDLAKKMGKSESEISKWLTGTHNLTLRSIAKIEAALGVEFLKCKKNIGQLHVVRFTKHTFNITTTVSKGPQVDVKHQDVQWSAQVKEVMAS